MKFLFVSFFTGFLLIGCASVATPTATVLPISTDTAISSTVIPSPTNPDSDEYCKPPYAVLPVSNGNDISEDEIVHELMKIWLRRYANSDAPLSCRIDGFTIHKVYFDLEILSGPLEPRGDFMRLVDFSVKLAQTSSEWMSFSGELDAENWLHVRHAVSVFETTEGYTMQFAYP